MSTKTTFKRISLVTVAALGFGVVAAVPSFAAASTVAVTTGAASTQVYGDSKLVPTAGSTITLDAILAITENASPAADETTSVVATVTTKPNNSTVAADSVTASATGAATAYAAATTSANALRFYQETAATVAAAKLGTFTFTPDVPGLYTLTLTPKNGGVAGLTSSAGTARTVTINVAGLALTQGATNLGKATTGTQILGRPSTFTYNLPAGTAQNQRFTIKSSGTITSVYSGTANLGSTASAYTANTGVTAVSGTTYAAGAIYTAQAAVTTTAAISSNNYPSAMEQISILLDSPATASEVTVTVTTADVLTGEVTTVGAGKVTYAAAVVPAKPDTTSTSFISAGDVSSATSDSATVSGVLTAGTIVATIITTQKTADVATSAPESITAVITGSGTLSTVGTGQSGRGITAKFDDVIKVKADGTSGVGIVTLTGATSGLVYKTVSVTFYDQKPATATVTVKKAYPAAGKTTSSAVYVTVKDALSNVVKDASVVLSPTTTGTGETTTAASCVYSSTLLTNVCSITGTSALKFGKVSYVANVTGANTAATEISSAAFDVTFADSVATKVAITAPATGAVGDKITVTFTATEKNGYPVADSTYEGVESTNGKFWNTTTVPTYSSASFAPFNAGETITTLSGVATKEIYLPAVSGTVTGSWKLAGTAGTGVNSGPVDKTILGTVIDLAIAVTNPGTDAALDAANEATDAANAATDAALAAADAADAATAAAEDASAAVAKLAKSVNTALKNLKKQITALTALVNKLLK